MFWYILVLLIAVEGAATVRAQVAENGQYVEVGKGTTLCASAVPERPRGMVDASKVFWRVTSKARANGTQTIAPFVLETLYDRKSGDTTITERQYDEDYATFFKKDPAHQGMLLMVSPQDGGVQAIVEICPKRPKSKAPGIR